MSQQQPLFNPATTTSTPSQPNSCQLCQQRKVKCNRQQPCVGCAKANVECVYRVPPPPKRRKRKSPEEVLRARLRRYEEILRDLGVRLNDGDDADVARLQHDVIAGSRSRESPAVPPGTSSGCERTGESDSADGLASKMGRLIVADGKSRFLENTLWVSVGDELAHSSTLLDTSSQDDGADESAAALPIDHSSPDDGRLLFGSSVNDTDLLHLHPNPTQLFQLWQKYLENVDLLTKVFHTPTVQQQVLSASGDFSGVSKPLEALMFAIYLCAVVSMSDQQCLDTMHESRDVLLRRFRFGTQQALINADLIKTSDLTVLRAFVLYLMAMRHYMEAQMLWVLSGVALRIAQRIGLHHDGASLDLSVFETEMRRRLWWQIVVMDGFSAELSGVGLAVGAYSPAMPLPLNVNDSDLDSNMKETPIEHHRITEMSFCLLRYEIGRYLRDSKTKQMFDGAWQHLSNQQESAWEKIGELGELEKRIEQKFLRYCDNSIPFHFMVFMVGRCSIAMMKHRVYGLGSSKRPIGCLDSDRLFSESIKILEYDNLAKTMPSARRYYWHVEAHFQWHAFIFVLYELQKRLSGAEVDDAWSQIEIVYKNRAKSLSNPRNKLAVVTGNLVLKAWERRVQGLPAGSEAQTPLFIQYLTVQRTGSRQRPREHTNIEAFTQGSADGPTLSVNTTPLRSEMACEQPFDAASTMSNPSFDTENLSEMQGLNCASNVLLNSSTANSAYYSPNWTEWEALLRNPGLDDDIGGVTL